MEQFKYRLQPLLDLKLEKQTQLQLALVQRQKELAAEKEALEQLRREQARIQEKLTSARPGVMAGGNGVTGREVRLYVDYLRGLEADLAAAIDAVGSQQLRIREFEERVVKARQAVAECAREIEVLNKYRARLEKRFLDKIGREEALAQDEIGNTMFVHGRRANESFR